MLMKSPKFSYLILLLSIITSLKAQIKDGNCDSVDYIINNTTLLKSRHRVSDSIIKTLKSCEVYDYNGITSKGLDSYILAYIDYHKDNFQSAIEKLENVDFSFENDLIAYRAKVLLTMLYNSKVFDYTKAIIYCNDAIDLNKKLKLSDYETDSLFIQLYAIQTSLGNYEEALSSLEQISDTYFLVDVIKRKFQIYSLSDNYDAFSELLNTYKENRVFSKNDITVIETGICGGLLSFGKYDVITSLFANKALRMTEEDVYSGQFKYLVGFAYLKQDLPYKSIEYFTSVSDSKYYKIEEPIFYKYSRIMLLAAYSKIGDFDAYYEHEELLLNDIKDWNVNSNIYVTYAITKAKASMRLKNYDKAIYILNKIIPGLEKRPTGTNNLLQDIYNNMAQAQLRIGNFEESTKYFQKVSDIVSAKFQEEEKENLLSRDVLKNKYDGQLLESKSKLDEIKINLLEEKVVSQQYLWLSILVLTILLVIVYFYYNNRKKKKIIEDAYSLIRKEKSEVDKLIKEREKLLAHVTHQAKLPFINIKYLVEMFDSINDASEEEQQFLRSEMTSSIHKVSKQMFDILNWTKAVLDTRVELTRVPLKDLVDQVIRECEILITEKDVRIHNNINNIEIKSNYYALKAIMTNLLTNSIKYSKKEAEITIDYSKHKLVIVDQGQKIPESLKNEILSVNPISVTSKDNQQTLKSSGMGLYLVKDLCKRINASFQISSTKNNQNQFFILFNNS